MDTVVPFSDESKRTSAASLVISEIPRPSPVLSRFGRMPLPLSPTATISLPRSRRPLTRIVPGLRSRNACRIAFVTASLTASLTSLSGAPTLRARSAAARRATATLPASEGSCKSSSAVPDELAGTAAL